MSESQNRKPKRGRPITRKIEIQPPAKPLDQAHQEEARLACAFRHQISFALIGWLLIRNLTRNGVTGPIVN